MASRALRDMLCDTCVDDWVLSDAAEVASSTAVREFCCAILADGFAQARGADCLAALPSTRRHRHRHQGALAPSSPLRAAAIVDGCAVTDGATARAEPAEPCPAPCANARFPARSLWAMPP